MACCGISVGNGLAYWLVARSGKSFFLRFALCKGTRIRTSGCTLRLKPTSSYFLIAMVPKSSCITMSMMMTSRQILSHYAIPTLTSRHHLLLSFPRIPQPSSFRQPLLRLLVGISGLSKGELTSGRWIFGVKKRSLHGGELVIDSMLLAMPSSLHIHVAVKSAISRRRTSDTLRSSSLTSSGPLRGRVSKVLKLGTPLKRLETPKWILKITSLPKLCSMTPTSSSQH